MQSSYSPTFKRYNRTLQLKCYRKILWSCKKHGLFTTCSTTQRRGKAQTSPPALPKHAHIREPPAFTVILSSPANLRIFPFWIIVWQWITDGSSVAGPKIGLGAEKGWGRGNLSCAQPWVSQATVSRLFYLQTLQILLGAITFPCSMGYFCSAALTVPRSRGNKSHISMRWSLHPG